jgi:hypothetical protein
VAGALTAHAQSQINWSAISGGGGTSTSSVYSVNATIGQPNIGLSSGGGYLISSGFWSVLGVIQMLDAPELLITHTGGAVVISWPLPATGWVLDQTSAFVGTSTSWTEVTVPNQVNATHAFVTLPVPAGNAFFRLRKP